MVEPETNQVFHPSYSSLDADLLLSSKDGVKFRVHSVVLKLASGVFRDMLSIPRAASEGAGDPIQLEESGEVLSAVLDLIYPSSALPDMPTFDFVRDLSVACEKYEMAGATQTIKKHVFGPRFVYPALKMFSLSRQLEWDSESKIASSETLSIDLSQSQALDVLRTIDTDGVLKLQALHRLRKSRLVEALNNIGSNDSAIAWRQVGFYLHLECSAGYQLRQHAHWIICKLKIAEEMDRSSTGGLMRIRTFWTQTLFAPIWTLQCSRCNSCLFDLDKTMSTVLRVLDELPTTI